MLTGIDRLEAMEAIQKLPLRYSAAIEHRDVDAMASLFSPNARFGPYGNRNEEINFALIPIRASTSARRRAVSGEDRTGDANKLDVGLSNGS
jgi:hypothetical protein